jgi:hypothetical protein
VKKRGPMIGFVDYDPIKGEYGNFYDLDGDGTVWKRE